MSSDYSDESKNNSWSSLFDHFNQTVRTEADTLLKNIAVNQTNLINERDCLRKEIEMLKKEKAEMTQLLKKYDQIVSLNIGGQLFSTTMETLTREKCLFTKMFSGQFDLREHQSAIFIDRDPTHFRLLLNYLRTNTFIEPKSVQDRAEILLEAEYYQITSLVQQLKGESLKNTIIVEKLLFDYTLHHPQVVISENGLKATFCSGCITCLYAKVQNTSWHNGQHYWEIIVETPSGGGGCYSSMGIAISSWTLNQRLGDNSSSWTLRLCDQQTDFQYTGIRHDGKSSTYYKVFPKGTRVGALLDLDAGTLKYVIDGIKRGVAFDNLKGHTVTPVFELCDSTTTFRMNHEATAPAI